MTSQRTPIPFLDLTSQHRALKEEIMHVFAEAVDQGSFIGGPMVSSFEVEFAAYVGSPYAVGVGSGTDALRFALLALGIGPGHHVITVPNTFIATTEAISQVGAHIEFVDIDPATSLMEPNRLEEFLKRRFATAAEHERPSAIIPVHLYGQCADMDPILELARQYELKVVEDAAQAHGATYKGRHAGTMGDVAAFSFYPGKNLGACGEAGAVTTNNQTIADSVRMLRDHGQHTKYYHAMEGYNGRLDAVQAGILRLKLRHLERWNAQRREHALAYNTAFTRLPWVRPVQILPDNLPVYHLYVIHAAHRDALRLHLQAHGIATALHYPLPLHLQGCYARLNYKVGDFPMAERSAAELLSLPMFPELEPEHVQRVVQVVEAYTEAVCTS